MRLKDAYDIWLEDKRRIREPSTIALELTVLSVQILGISN